MKLKRLSSLCSALIISFSGLMTIAFNGTVFAAAAYTCTWTGATNGNFSNAGNWTGCNNAAPVPSDNDNLVFDSTNLSANTAIANDITGLALTMITFSGSNSGSNQYTIIGNTISLSGGILVNGSNYPSIDTNLNLTASQSITGTGVINFGDSNYSPTLSVGANTLTIGSGSDSVEFSNQYGTITGSGSMVSQGNALLQLGHASPGWTGAIRAINKGSIIFGVGGAGSASSVTIPDGSYVCFSGYNGANFTRNLIIGGSYSLSSVPGCQTGGGVPAYNANASVNLTGNISLTANTTIYTEGTVTISGPISGNYTIGLEAGGIGKLVINSANNTSQSPNGSQTSALQVTTIAAGDNQPSSVLGVTNNQEYIVDGVRGTTDVYAGGILKGTGTLGDLTVQSATAPTAAGIVSPGHSPGCLTINGVLNEGGTYDAQIGGTTACSEYDQLNVTGIVTLNDGLTPPTAGNLQISLVNGFKPSAGQTYEIINNQSAQPVVGTFAGLAEGAQFTASGYVFKISYIGGTGNDVVLTVVSAPAAPNTGIGLLKTNFGIYAAGTMLMAGAVYIISRKLKYAKSTTRR